MFKYINMPRLVAHYLKEFSVRSDGTTSDLYRFMFCLCLPFVFPAFRRARLIALMIAECTNSADQVSRVLFAATGAQIHSIVPGGAPIAYDGSGDVPQFAYDGSVDTPLVPYGQTPNNNIMYIELGSASLTEVQALLPLLIPFYVNIEIRVL